MFEIGLFLHQKLQNSAEPQKTQTDARLVLKSKYKVASHGWRFLECVLVQHRQEAPHPEPAMSKRVSRRLQRYCIMASTLLYVCTSPISTVDTIQCAHTHLLSSCSSVALIGDTVLNCTSTPCIASHRAASHCVALTPRPRDPVCSCAASSRPSSWAPPPLSEQRDSWRDHRPVSMCVDGHCACVLARWYGCERERERGGYNEGTLRCSLDAALFPQWCYPRVQLPSVTLSSSSAVLIRRTRSRCASTLVGGSSNADGVGLPTCGVDGQMDRAAVYTAFM